jgi:hypothetical protein
MEIKMENKIIEIMSHYITPDNQILGFDNTQTHLVPDDAVLIPDTYTMEQIPYITLVSGVVTYNKAKHDVDVEAIASAQQEIMDAKASALAKLAALGLTEDEVKALVSL